MINSAPQVSSQNQSFKHPLPVLRVTFYDRFSSFMMAIVVGLMAAVVAVITLCNEKRPPIETGLVEVEWVRGAAGLNLAEPVETLKVESLDASTTFASASDAQISEQQIENTLATVEELADAALKQIQQLEATADLEHETPGSSIGSQYRSLGSNGEFDQRGPEQRWFIQFAEAASVEEYTRQLDFFDIELGALFRERGELIYLSNLSSVTPQFRVVRVVDDERLYMSWQGGQRRAADAELFERAGVNAASAVILHFYPRALEERLARLEADYSNRPIKEIRRTYFVVIKQGAGYSFAITQQHYFR